MSDLKITGEVVVTSEKAEAAFDRVGNAAQGMANDVTNSANQASKAVDGIGAGADQAAEQFTRAEGRMAAAIKRATRDYELLGKTASQKLEFNITERGLDATKFEPLLKELRAVEAQALRAKTAAVGSLDNMGISAKQTAAALRGVPAQFTDIITSLQGGQAPMTVLLQQGGQLKDMFGGVGNAAKALGGYVLGLVNPITVTAAALGAVGFAAYKGSKEWEEYSRALILTGNAVGVTATQLNNMAASVAKSTGGTQGAAAEALVALTNSTGIASSNFKRFAEVAVVTQRDVGTAIADTVKQFAELGKAPLENSLKLNESTKFLTVSIYQQIKALEERGNKEAAASLAQNALAKAREDQAAAIKASLGYLETGWNNVAFAAKKAWDSMLNVGRPVDPTEPLKQSLASAEQALERARDKAKTSGLRGQEQANADAHVKRMERAVAARQQELALQEKGAGYEALSAAYQQQGAARLDAQVAFDKQHDQFLSKRVQMERELLAVRAQAAKANEGADAQTIAANQIKLAEAEAGIRKKFAEAAATASKAKPDAWVSEVAKAYTKAMSELDAEQIKASSSADSLSKTQEALRRVQSGPEWAAMSRRQQEEVIMAASLSQAEEDRLATMRAAQAENVKYIAGLTESATAHEAKRQALADEVAAYKVAIEKNISLAEAIEEVALARLQEQKAIEMSYGNDKAVEQINREIKARKELAALKGAKADHAAEIDAGKAAAAAVLAEWKQGWTETDRLAREAFTTWATDGSNAAQKIGDTLKKALLSAIYEATLKPLVFQLYTSIAGGAPGGALGAINGAGSLFGSGSSGLSSTFSALGGNLASGFKAGLGAVFGEAGTLGGLSAGTTALGAGNIMGGLGTLAGTALPWLAGASLLQSLTGYSVKSDGSALLANLGGGTTHGVAIRSDYTQSSSGIFSGGTTHNSDWKDADAQVTQFIQQQVKTVTDAARAYGAALGLPVDNLDSFKKQIEVSLTGLDAAGVQKALQGAIDGFANDLVSASFGDSLKEFAKSGESAGATLSRVASEFTAVNSTLETLGSALLDLDAAGIKAADGLVQAMGGLEAFNQQMASYYQNFYSGDEQRAQTAKSIQSALADVGLDYSVEQILSATRAQFRALVEAQDITTDSGRATYAALMKVSSAFANLTPTVESTTRAAEEASRRAAQEAQRIAERAAQEARRAEEEARRAAEAYQRQLEAARDYIKGISTRISDFLASLDAQAQDLQSYTRAAAAFSVQMVLARGGDRNALDGITTSASTLVDAIRRESSNASEANLRIGRMRGQLAGLPAQLSAEQFIVNELGGVITTTTATTTAAITTVVASVDDMREQIKQRLITDFAKLDTSVNGLLDFTEFSAGVAGMATDAELRNIFNELDTNGDGVISQLELISSNTASLQTGFGFDPNDPIRSVFDAIRADTLANGFIMQAIANNTNAAQYYLGASSRGEGSLKIRGETQAFAKGGVFANSIVSSPTLFDMGLMGEAGPEAIIPLKRTSTGDLGVQMVMPRLAQYGTGQQSQAALVEEIRALRTDNQAQALALVQLQKRMTKMLERWDGNGMPETRVVTA